MPIILHRINDFINIKVGNVYSTNQNGLLKIIDISDNIYTVQFIDTGYIRTTKLTKLKNGTVKDYYKPIIYGVGYLGDHKSISDKSIKRLIYDRWRDMLSRCYSRDNRCYRLYGAIGVHVCNRWLDFTNFYNDVQLIPGWDLKRFFNKELTLDKDKYQPDIITKVYSKDTCCWLTMKEQNEMIDFVKCHEDQMHSFIATFPDGHSELTLGIKRFSREYYLTPQSIINCLNGESLNHKGFSFKYA